tara:strand:- start:444 stop:641 length:198 start_codon:yes stop_codon:yes gene_type:complete
MTKEMKDRIAMWKDMADHFKKEINFYENTKVPNIVEHVKINKGCYEKVKAEIKRIESQINNQEIA